MTYETTDGSPLKYYIVYRLDSSMNHFFYGKSEGEMLDHIMILNDGNLAYYDVYLQIL